MAKINSYIKKTPDQLILKSCSTMVLMLPFYCTTIIINLTHTSASSSWHEVSPSTFFRTKLQQLFIGRIPTTLALQGRTPPSSPWPKSCVDLHLPLMVRESLPSPPTLHERTHHSVQHHVSIWPKRSPAGLSHFVAYFLSSSVWPLYIFNA